jgi:hypothetical protein
VLGSVAVPGVRLTAEGVLRVGSYGMDEADLTRWRSPPSSPTWPTPAARRSSSRAPSATRGEADHVAQIARAVAVGLGRDPAARGLGVVVAMGARAWPARHAAKIHTLALDAFAAPSVGPVADVSGVAVRVLARPPRPSRPPATRSARRCRGSSW